MRSKLAEKDYCILAIDEGTTSSRAILVNYDMQVLAKEQVEFQQHFPKPGWVEHNPDEIWVSVTEAVRRVIKASGIDSKRIRGIGITNQRETVTCFDRDTLKPLHNFIVWQCRRSSDICNQLKSDGMEPQFRQKTGLVLDPYFSGTKIKWLEENIAAVQEKDPEQKLVATLDSFLILKLTNGKVFATDVSNASRTLLMDLAKLEWDRTLCEILKVKQCSLPAIKSSSEIFGYTEGLDFLPDGIPICGVAGDQQAALFGQACFDLGEGKCTYGTGCFMLVNTGPKPAISENGLLTTCAWKIGKKTTYAIEGSTFVAGAVVQWLRDNLGFIGKSSEIETLAQTVNNSDGVIFVPAFTGLGAPYWKAEARGALFGLSRGTTKGHIARAALEGIAFQNAALFGAIQRDFPSTCSTLKVDGGASMNNLLMQFQSDILNVEIIRPHLVETTAMGAALLSGLAVSLWASPNEIRQKWRPERTFQPKMKPAERESRLLTWNDAVNRLL